MRKSERGRDKERHTQKYKKRYIKKSRTNTQKQKKKRKKREKDEKRKKNKRNVTTHPTVIAKTTTPLQEQQQLIRKRNKINRNKADSINRGSMLAAVIGLNR